MRRISSSFLPVLLLVATLASFASSAWAQATGVTITPPTAPTYAGVANVVKVSTTIDGSPLPGALVTLTVTGTNPQVLGPLTTDGGGVAEFTITPSLVGADTLTATFGFETDSKSVTWLQPYSIRNLFYSYGFGAGTVFQPLTITHELYSLVTDSPVLGESTDVTATSLSGPHIGKVATGTLSAATGSDPTRGIVTYQSFSAGTDNYSIKTTNTYFGEQVEATFDLTWTEYSMGLVPFGEVFATPNMDTITIIARPTVNGVPFPAGSTIDASITIGPNMGDSRTLTINESGFTEASYTSTASGVDPVIFSFVLPDGSSYSETVAIRWCQPGTIQLLSSEDDGPGTLRDAVLNVCDGGTIQLSGLSATVPSLAILDSRPIIISNGRKITIEDELGGAFGLPRILRSYLPETPNFRLFEVSGSSELTLRNIQLDNGFAAPEGGIIIEGTRDAQPEGEGPPRGGAVLVLGVLNLEGCVLFANSSAGTGGALSVVSGGLLIARDTIFVANSADGDSGAVDITGLAGRARHLFERCSFSNNVSSFGTGGAVRLNAGTDFLNCTFSGNSAILGNGGALDVVSNADPESPTARIYHSTFVNNIAGPVDGPYLEGGAIATTSDPIPDTEIYGNLFLDNQGITSAPPVRRGTGNANGFLGSHGQMHGERGASYSDLSGNFASRGYNIVGQGDQATGLIFSDKVGTLVSRYTETLTPPANFGGNTRMYGLTLGSQAIDFVPVQTTFTLVVDQRRAFRDSGLAIDAGAYEVQDYDDDGVLDDEENTVPSGLAVGAGSPTRSALTPICDGDSTGKPDSIEPRTASVRGVRPSFSETPIWVVLELTRAPNQSDQLSSVSTTGNPTTSSPPPYDPGNFPAGFVNFTVDSRVPARSGADLEGRPPDPPVNVRVTYSEPVAPSVTQMSYYKWGSSNPPRASDDKLFDFKWNGDSATTGARMLKPNQVLVRLRDQDVGDEDPTFDVIRDPGAIGGLVPLLVELASFSASGSTGGPVTVVWESAAEVDNVGFHLYRGASSGTAIIPGARLTTDIIPAQGGPSGGASYEYLDEQPLAPGEERWYFLEDIDLAGKRTMHGPVKATVTPAGATRVDDWMLMN